MAELQTVWGWQPALYLFLGGMGAGAFIMASILGLIDREGSHRTICVSMWAAVASLCLGLVLLVTELVFPLRGLMLWQSFSHFTSWMTIGAWVLFASVVVFGLMAIMSTQKLSDAVDGAWKGYAGVRKALWKPLSVVGMLLALGVAVYTGVLLMAVPGTPLWNTPLLPCLFTVSALDTGVALVEVASLTAGRKDVPAHDVHRLMFRIVVVLVIAEAAVLCAFMATMLAGGGAAVAGSAAAVAASSAQMLLQGQLAPVFWALFVACGLVLPLVAAIAGLTAAKPRGSHGGGANVVAAVASTGDSNGGNAATQNAGVSASSSSAVVQSPGASDGMAAAHAAKTSATAAEAERPHVSSATASVALIGALGALAGGCALRFLIVMAGVHADPVAETALTLIF